jgi:hypothetical protein
VRIAQRILALTIGMLLNTLTERLVGQMRKPTRQQPRDQAEELPVGADPDRRLAHRQRDQLQDLPLAVGEVELPPVGSGKFLPLSHELVRGYSREDVARSVRLAAVSAEIRAAVDSQMDQDEITYFSVSRPH